MIKINNQEIRVYIGTYTSGESKGIYVCRLKPSGELEVLSTAGDIKNPSFVAISPSQKYLYAVSEIGQYEGKPSGGVSAFSIDSATGQLTFLNQQASHGTSPCHLSVDQTERYVLVANYGTGSAAMLPILPNGELGEATDVAQHEGSGTDPGRQSAPHAHSINLDVQNKFAYVPDLGLDKVMIYQLDLENGKLIPAEQPWAETNPGAGPRHFAFHPNNKYAYVINELDSTLTSFSYDRKNGALSEIETLSTLPDDFSDKSYCADVHVLSSGDFVYGSNRGHDSIVIFKVNKESGKLTLVGYEPTQGNFPRGFAIDPTGTYLLAANQNGDNVVTFKIDHETGELEPTGHIAQIPKPVCVKMISV